MIVLLVEEEDKTELMWTTNFGSCRGMAYTDTCRLRKRFLLNFIFFLFFFSRFCFGDSLHYDSDMCVFLFNLKRDRTFQLLFIVIVFHAHAAHIVLVFMFVFAFHSDEICWQTRHIHLHTYEKLRPAITTTAMVATENKRKQFHFNYTIVQVQCIAHRLLSWVCHCGSRHWANEKHKINEWICWGQFVDAQCHGLPAECHKYGFYQQRRSPSPSRKQFSINRRLYAHSIGYYKLFIWFNVHPFTGRAGNQISFGKQSLLITFHSIANAINHRRCRCGSVAA